MIPYLSVGGALFGATVVFAFLVRIWDVGARAMHLDESTVAWFGWQLLTGHGYSYDPVYHGPFQHMMLALTFLLFGSSQTSARLLAVVLGTALVALPWFLRDYLGRPVALWTCFLLAISPSFVYFARFERDDTYMEFFTFLLVVLVLRFIRDRRPWQLYGALIAFALAFATKESIYIVVFILGSFLFLRALGMWSGRRFGGLRQRTQRFKPLNVVGGSSLRLGAVLLALLVAATMMSIVWGLYLPVPTLLALMLAAGVIWSFCDWSERARYARSLALQRSWIWNAEWRPHWVSGLTVAGGIIVLMYSTFGANLNGLWDQAHPFFNNGNVCQFPLAFNLDACRKDIVGGLFYWLSQHKVARGGQPWYYFLLIFGLYEQLAIVFAGIGGAVTFLSRRLRPGQRCLRMFVLYWATLSVLIYSWAGEKFPWLGIHPLLPISLMAAFGIMDTISSARRRAGKTSRLPAARVAFARVAVALLGLLVVVELHNTFTLNFVDGANPVEMMVYVQSAPDTIADANRIGRLSHQVTGGNTLPVGIDNADTWPFAWYLRDMPDVGYPAGASGLTPSDPIIILDQTDAQSASLPSWLTTGYTRSLRRLDWWFPEDYKQWTWSDFFGNHLTLSSLKSIWNWEVFRTPFGIRDGNWYYLYIKKGYFPAF